MMKKLLHIHVLIIAFSAPCLAVSDSHDHEEPNQSTMEYAKELFMEKVAIPLYIHFDRIKEEGISKEDLVVASLGALTIYGAKRVGDRYHLWNGIRKGDLSDMKAVMHEDASWLWEHKGTVVLGVAATTALAWLVKTGWNLPIVERFRRSLTGKQKEIISSDPTLQELIDKVHEDPTLIHDHEEFSDHLHDHQKELLKRAVREHKEKHDPFSLFDDFEYTDDDLDQENA